jgi:hypothetical protein
VLYVDGEMSPRLLAARLKAEAKRLGCDPEGFHALSIEDLDQFEPLNTPSGRKLIKRIVSLVGGFCEPQVDLVIFDNVMSLTQGSMIEEQPWRQLMPLIKYLTKERVGQLWVHHAGHDKTRGFGTSIREWELDNVLHLDEVQHRSTDVSFKPYFHKGRERTPETRADYADAHVMLLDDKWLSSAAKAPSGPVRTPSPKAQQYLEALAEIANSSFAVTLSGHRGALRKDWQAKCGERGLFDTGAAENVQRANFSKYQKQLLDTGVIACEGDFIWPI